VNDAGSDCAHSISVIVPVYNEACCIDQLLHNLNPLKNQCEIVFVDSGSTDNTADQISEWSSRCYFHSPDKGRANQMNYGASVSHGSILWFLHADSIPPPDALSKIQEVISKGYSYGCFRLKFDSMHPLMFYMAFMSNIRVKTRKIAFGDQGIFIKRMLFDQLGGYAPIPLMEDYKLSMDVKRAGYALRIADGTITTSERRFSSGGHFRTMMMMQSLQRKFRKGDNIEEIARCYSNHKEKDGKI